MAVPVFRAAGTAAAGTSTTTPGMPTGYQAGDLLLCVVRTENQTGTGLTPTTTTGTWVAVAAHVGTGSSGVSGAATGVQVFKKIAVATEGTTTVPDSGVYTMSRIYAYSGADAVTPVAASPAPVTGVETPADTSGSAPGLTGVTVGQRIIVVAANSADTTTTQYGSAANSTLTGLANRSGGQTATQDGGGYTLFDGTANATTVAATTWTQATSSVKAFVTFALTTSVQTWGVVAAAVAPPPQVVIDALGQHGAAGEYATGTNTLAWTHVIAGSATLLLVGVSLGANPDATPITADVTGQPMTSLGVVHTNNSTAGYVQLFALGDPPAGTATITITKDAGATTGSLTGGSISFLGTTTDLAVALDAPVTGYGATGTATATVASSSAYNLVFAVVANGQDIGAVGGTSVSRWVHNGDNASAAGNCAAQTAPGTGSNVVMSRTVTADWYAIIAVDINAAPTSAGSDGNAYLGIPRSVTATSVTVSRGDAGLTIPGQVTTWPVQATAVATSTGTAALVLPPAVITGLAGGATGYFTDQHGNPRMVLGDAPWALCGNVGRWSSGAWAADYDTFLATRAAQGFTVIYTKPMGTTQCLCLGDDGRTFDTLYPFQGGSMANPSTGLTAAYWARIDYFLASALAKGITVFLNAVGYASDFESAGPLAGKSNTEFQAYGAAIGARYKDQPNLVWMVADDYYSSSDSKLDSFLTGVRSAGDTHPISIENYPETTSRHVLAAGRAALAWGNTNASFNFVYCYEVTYFGVEAAYAEATPGPVLQSDGYFCQEDATNVYYAPYGRAMRQYMWWALSSGSRGFLTGSEGIWQWASVAQTYAAGQWWYNHCGPAKAAVEALAGWHQLLPDTASALVTSGRGTHATYTTTAYNTATTDTYVTASKTPSGSLALIYLSHGSTIGINEALMGGAGTYTAARMDPVSGALTTVTPGASYNSTAWGNNSVGDPDWALVLTGTGATQWALTATGSATAVGSATVTLSPAVLAATGASVSAGSAGAGTLRVVTASGAGASAGAGTLVSTLAAAASGAGVSAGSAAAGTLRLVTATSVTVSAGALVVTGVLAVTATGTTTSAAPAAVGTLWALTATGAATSTGAVTTTATLALAGAGTTLSTGTAAVGALWLVTATGQNVPAGTLVLTSALVFTATGAATSGGSAVVTSGAGPVTWALATTAPTASAGTAALTSAVAAQVTSATTSAGTAVMGPLALAATATSTSAGAITLAITSAAQVTGTATSTGTATLVTAPGALAASGATTSAGAALAVVTAGLPVAAVGTTTTAATAALTVVLAAPVTGTTTSAGAAVLTTAPGALSAAGATTSTSSAALAVTSGLPITTTSATTSAGTWSAALAMTAHTTASTTSTGTADVGVAGQLTITTTAVTASTGTVTGVLAPAAVTTTSATTSTGTVTTGALALAATGASISGGTVTGFVPVQVTATSATFTASAAAVGTVTAASTTSATTTTGTATLSLTPAALAVLGATTSAATVTLTATWALAATGATTTTGDALPRVVPLTAALAGLGAGPPHGRYAAGAPHGSGWAARPPHR